MMRRTIIIAAFIGFSVPILFGVFGIVLFSARGGGWEEFVVLRLPNFICPPWVLGDGRAFWMIVIPLLNALLYATLAAILTASLTKVRGVLR
jgi:hypothetical protein